MSYSEQAKQLGKKKAVRAIGSANGKNPIPIIVPCHRVIAKGGRLGGYAGLSMKKKLLALEQKFSLSGHIVLRQDLMIAHSCCQGVEL